MRVWLLLLCAVACALVALVMLWPRGSGASAPATDATRSGDASRASVSVARTPASAPLRERQTANVQGSGEVRGFEVRVLEDGSRKPVAGAEVSICDLDLVHARIRAREAEAGTALDGPEQAAMVTAMSTVQRTEGSGRARLPVLGKTMLIEATASGGFWGRRLLAEPPSAPVEILVGVDKTLRVRVLSSAGRTVPGVRVAVRRRGAPMFKTSAADGIATFDHVQSVTGEPADYRVGLGFPLHHEPEVVVPANVPAEPVVLVLPDTGSLAIALIDEHGQAVDGAPVDLRVAVFDTAERVREAGPSSMPRAGANGVALVPYVGLGFFLRVTATPREAGSRHRAVVVDVDGPQQPGQAVRCEVLWRSAADPRASYPVVAGRLVRSDGRPWPAAELDAWASIFPLPASYHGSSAIAVAADGRFRLVLAQDCPPGGKRIYRLTARAPRELAGIEGRLDLSRAFAAGETELGDIVLDHGALLASGAVVDSQGAPLASARVELRQLVQERERAMWPTLDCAGRFLAADGTFALHAMWGQELPRSRLRLNVSCGGFATRDVDLALGEPGLRVVLERGGKLAGSVRLNAGQHPGDIAIVLLRDQEGIGSPRLIEDGSFEQDQLAPGRLSLVAYLRTGSQADRSASRVEVDDLIVVPGETNCDPRIQGLSIRGTVATLAVRVTDRSGSPIERANVEASGALEVQSDAAGVATLRLEKLPADVRVTAFGYRDVLLRDVSADRDVVLDPGLHIRLVTDAKPQGRDPDYHLGFSLWHIDAQGRRQRMVYAGSFPYDRMYFDDQGRASLPMPGPGTYEVEPRVFVLRKDHIGAGGPLRLRPAPRITVLEVADVQTFHVAIPQSVLDAAVRAHER